MVFENGGWDCLAWSPVLHSGIQFGSNPKFSTTEFAVWLRSSEVERCRERASVVVSNATGATSKWCSPL